ncbi:MAG: DNA polymerase III subunit beta [Acutalibacteraceae bacterium]|nr:DNA polymerase III subunit beta [Acutalibacteraceae bacterium]
MKFRVARAEFLDAVLKMQKTVGSKSSMPVLEGILLSAEQGLLTLSSYNLEMGMKKEIYASCEQEGDIVINARLLAEILRKLRGIDVEIECDDRLVCHIKSGEAVFDIMGMQASDFPEMPSLTDGENLILKGEDFVEMVKGTIFAVSQIEGTRPILTGINISVKDGVLQFVAIDGYRLAIRRKNINIENNTEFIVSGKALNEVVKLIDENTENIEIKVGKRLILFKIDGYVFISRLLEGEFVNYEKIIPTEYKQCIEIENGEITDSIERVSLLINDTFSTPIRCAFYHDELNISCATSLGRAKEKLNIELEGEDFEIGLNSRYLLDALKACESDKIVIKFNGSNAGVTITPAENEDNKMLYLIMPMRLK